MNDAHEHVEDYSFDPAERRAAEAAKLWLDPIPQAAHPTVEAMLAIERTIVEIDAVLAERKQIHGDFTDDATLAQGLKDLMQSSNNWRAMTPVMREALEHIQTKVARICSGDFNHADHWRDLQGYPRLVEERL